MFKGIVMKEYDEYLVVFSDGDYFQLKNNHSYEQGQVILFTKADIYNTNNQRRNFMKKYKSIAALAASLVIMISIGFYMNEESYDSIVVVDINPSIQLNLDSDEVVVGYEALNEDAGTMDLSTIEGMTVDKALEFITQSAVNSGFLDVDDLEDDFILVTTISKADEEDVNELIAELKETSELMKSVNVAITTASEKDLEEAKEEDVPVGLLAIEGSGAEVDLDSVKNYFNNALLAAAFENEGTILLEDFGHKVDRVNNNLADIEMDESLKQEIMSGFLIAKNEFFEAKKVFVEKKKLYQEALASGDEEAIVVAKLAMDEAEIMKNVQESIKDNVEAIKELLIQALEDEKNIIELEEKAEELAEKAAEKVEKAEEKEAEKVEKAEEKAAEKVEKAEEKEAEKVEKAEEKEAEKVEEAAEKEAEEAEEVEEEAEDAENEAEEAEQE